MTFEERLDIITERHAALAQTVELLAAMQRDSFAEHEKRFAENERRFAENERRSAENERRFAENERRFADTDRRIGQVLEAITSLANIAEAHEQRLEHLEGQ
jgi:septal ring factor EnvC (AmiA/AmiB activator)